MMEWRGKPVSDAVLEDLQPRIGRLKERGTVPKLMVLRVGERPEDLAYERGIGKRFAAAGALAETAVFPVNVSQDVLEEAVRSWNEREDVHGILIFRPLPRPLDENRLVRVLDPEKDVDGMTERNALRVYFGDRAGFAPCTPQAVLEMLDYYGYDVCGKNVAVIGRSRVVGRPLAMLLLSRNATVTVCHTKTRRLNEICRNADVVVACAGSPRMVDETFVRPETVLLDVGINACEGGVCGDADYEKVLPAAFAVTPVPGGVGSVTTSVLLKHVVESAERSALAGAEAGN
ncbi:MAG: bifunctional 5,10-methylenetetrahydrofolate dehydrogenase/5,10-methenyltetrahydrofolate cyclohydrolase [Clostridia bacterium]|nr:bifunctional 5,10-methylenetetrahydrofolate dehydrogenase/5,10-methenyltetrahydrofolate cyclohydrolase [Clostridia bacterium]